MDLIKITDLTTKLGLSSRTLRYYEQMGLVKSVRREFEKYRYFDDTAVERLRQIMVLRKMQIPIRDILKIFESEDMTALVSVFVEKIREIDSEVTALNELKSVINEFLRAMNERGVTKISALPLLYEEMDRQLELLDERKPITYEELGDISERLTKPVEASIISLPAMRVLSSILKKNPDESDAVGFWRWVQARDIPRGEAGRHELFEYQTAAGDVAILRIGEDFDNDSDYADYMFDGGLYAAANVYVDEDLGDRFRALVKSFDGNKFYEIDYNHSGELRHPTLIENLISPDEKRELVQILVPVKKRVADPGLFGEPVEITDISIEEIEKQNMILWTTDVPLDKLTPINNPHYKVLDSGEVEYTGWISTRVLSTNVAVKQPYRVDIEFKIYSDDQHFGYGASEDSIVFYHTNEIVAAGTSGIIGYGINCGNYPDRKNEAIRFEQPIFGNKLTFHKRGGIKYNEYNQLTWIIGERHLAIIINGEIRYCGTSFPYMSFDLSRETAKNIIIGSNGQGMRYFRKISISQLVHTPKTKIKKEELIMITKRSNNIIPIVHRLITDEHGENYWFNGCAGYVMECLGESDYDYSFFSGITGDNFTQHYKFHFPGDATTAHRQVNGDTKFFEDVFAKCGYAATFVLVSDIYKNKEMYLQTLIAYIDKGIPVITLGVVDGLPYGVYVGYEEHGKTLLYITGNGNEPERISCDDAITDNAGNSGWIFVGEKKEQKELKQIYREAIFGVPELLTTNDDKYCFGAAAFRTWADDIETGKYDNIKPEEFDHWSMYTNFVCVLATNGSCCHEFLKRAQQLNPDMTYLEEVSCLYRRTADMWNNDNGTDLEALGGGFNVTLEALQDKERRAKIAAKIREFADVSDKIVDIIRNAQ